MTKSKRIKLLEEYAKFLEKTCRANTVFLHVHGIKVPQETIDEGNRLRQELEWVRGWVLEWVYDNDDESG